MLDMSDALHCLYRNHKSTFQIVVEYLVYNIYIETHFCHIYMNVDLFRKTSIMNYIVQS